MRVRNSIFQHLFTRMAIILLGTSVVFPFALMPIYNDKLVRMLAAQGNTFANTTIGACGKALYDKDYSFVITYTNKVLKKTPEITFVTFIPNQGKPLKLTASSSYTVTSTEHRSFTGENKYNIIHSSKLADSTIRNAFVFSKPISIIGFDWGTIELGISDAEYDSLMSSYLQNVLLFSVMLVLISLMIMLGVSRKLAHQLSNLHDTARALSDGNLAARAPTATIGEIQLLANTFNSMAESLEIKTRSAHQLARLVEDTNDAIAIFGHDEKISFVNPAFMNITRHSFDFYNGMSLQALFEHLGIEKKLQHEISTGLPHIKEIDWTTDITISTQDRKPIHMTLRIEAFDSEDSQSSGFFVVLSDITRRKQLEFELETLAYMDKLTKLPNRRFFMDRLSEALKQAEVFATSLAVFFLDLDNFKIINDSLGHEVGDIVLCEAASRIQDALRSDDIVCRLGGDEFTVIIKDVQYKHDLARIAESIIQNFKKPIDHEGHDLCVGTSIGIVQYPGDGKDEKEIIKNADTAMYAAKRAGKSAFCFFTQDINQDQCEYLEMEGDLRKAIANSDLQLYYQPFFEIETQTISSCEALLRWNHPQHGFISPARFIPVAEQSGLIGAIGNWVFTEVCRQLKQWTFNIDVSINVSGSELIDKHLLERLSNTLDEYDIEAHRLQLEFTEQVLVGKEGSNLAILNALKRMGFMIAVDDFGTGFSSLSYLTELPVDTIKIDKSFINKLPHDRRTIAVVNSIISLAESLDMVTIGEGVENKEQVDWLCAHGCRTIQGYYFYKPMPATALEELMLSRNVTKLPFR